MLKKVIIYGASGHGKVAADCFLKSGTYELVGFIDDGKAKESSFYDLSILGSFNALQMLLDNDSNMELFVAIGDNWTRKLVSDRIKESFPSISFANAIHPSVVLAAGVELGQGNLLAAGSIINSDSRIGDFCIINTRASLDHDNVLGDFVSIAPGAVLGGDVQVGKLSAVSIGATIKHGLRIGKNSVLGAGGVLLRDLPGNQVAYGVPAKVIRVREDGEKYL